MSYANPAPPGEADDDASRPKTNDDFRKALLAPRSTKTPSNERQIKSKSSKNQHKRPRGERKEDASAYRDRARERREREDVDGDDANDGPKDEARGVFEASTGDAVKDAKAREVAESKFLGGDVSRTHLVKGLDFALLRKVREDIADERAMRSEETGTREGRETSSGEAKFKSARGRALYEFVHGKEKRIKDGRAKALASGAVCYSFDISSSLRQDVPTTAYRAIDDDGMAGIRALRAYVDPTKDAGLLTRLGKLMHYLALGSEKAIKKFRRDERRAAEEAKAAERSKKEEEERRARGAKEETAEASSDEDIFADAGRDYVPMMPAKSTKSEDTTCEEKGKSFFGDTHAGGEASAPAPKARTIAADDYVLDEDDGATHTNAFGAFGDYAGDYGDYDVDYGNASFDKRRGGDDPAKMAEAAKKEAIRKKRQLGNEFTKIRSMIKEQHGDKDDVAFEDDKKSSKRAKKK
jgi:IK cytokine